MEHDAFDGACRGRSHASIDAKSKAQVNLGKLSSDLHFASSPQLLQNLHGTSPWRFFADGVSFCAPLTSTVRAEIHRNNLIDVTSALAVHSPEVPSCGKPQGIVEMYLPTQVLVFEYFARNLF
jgi:hypothetical protein